MAKKSRAPNAPIASTDSSDQKPETSAKHDIRPGQSLELLKELHILTRDGKMNQDSRRKLKQFYLLFQFIDPACGNSCKTVFGDAGRSWSGQVLPWLHSLRSLLQSS